MIIFLGILIVATRASEASSTWHGPVNTCAVAGHPVTMTCQTPASSNSTSWYYTAFGSNRKLLISDGEVLGNGFKEFQVSGEVPGQMLTLEVVQMKHAGMYACSALMPDKAVKLEEATALLIVLESQPVCTLKSRQVKVGVDIEMVCTVNFTGPLPPTMEWKQHGTKDDFNDGGSVIRDGQINTATTHNTTTSTARIKADSSRHNSTYSCRTYFTQPSAPLNVNATNVPDYNYTWTSSSVQVIYGPSGVGIVPQQDVFYPGDVLTCVADASPTPVFTWRSLEPRNVFNGPELFIRISMIRDQPYVFQCHITHVMTGSNLTSESIKFTVKNNRCISTAVADTNLWIIIAVVFVCVVIIIAFSVHFVCLKRRSRALASLNGQTRPSDEAVTLGLAVNNEPIYSEYTEIPSYNVCREAMDRCHNRPVSNVGYLPMERNSNTSIRGALPEAPGKARASACPKSACQNNEYMTTDDDVLGPGYAVSASPTTEVQHTMDETTSTYLNLSARKQSSSTDYAVLATTCEEQELLLGEERQPKEPKTNEEKTKDQNDYLLPLSD